MALETVSLVVDKNWSLLSNATGGLFEADVVSGSALLSVGAAAPAADSGLGRVARSYRYTALDGKVWARAVGDAFATLSLTRVVDAANAAPVVLPAATLSASSFAAGAVAGTEIATIDTKLSGAVVDRISPADGRVVLSADRTKLLRGLSAVSAGDIEVSIYTTHPLAPNGSRKTVLTLNATATPILLGGSPPAAVEGQDYFWQPLISGGLGARRFSLSGSLPRGWTMSASGAISAPANAVVRQVGPAQLGTMTVSDDGGSSSLDLPPIAIKVGGRSLAAAKRIGIIGSSSEAEWGAGDQTTAPFVAGAKGLGYMSVAMKRLAARGLLLNQDGQFGMHGLANVGILASYDQALSGVTAAGSGLSSMGGAMLQFSGASQASVTRAFADCTWIDLMLFCTSVAGTQRINYSVDGGPVQAFIFDAATGNVMNRHRIAGLARGPHTITVSTPAQTANVYVAGLDSGNDDKAIHAMNFGIGGATTNLHTATNGPYSPMTALAKVQADVMIDTFGGNESFSGASSLDDFIARCTTWYNNADSLGIKSVMLIKPFIYAGAAAPGWVFTETQVRDARIALANSRNMPWFDLSGPAGPHANVQANGELAPDATHYKASWHQRVGFAVGDWLYDTALPAVGAIA